MGYPFLERNFSEFINDNDRITVLKSLFGNFKNSISASEIETIKIYLIKKCIEADININEEHLDRACEKLLLVQFGGIIPEHTFAKGTRTVAPILLSILTDKEIDEGSTNMIIHRDAFAFASSKIREKNYLFVGLSKLMQQPHNPIEIENSISDFVSNFEAIKLMRAGVHEISHLVFINYCAPNKLNNYYQELKSTYRIAFQKNFFNELVYRSSTMEYMALNWEYRASKALFLSRHIVEDFDLLRLVTGIKKRE